MQIDSSNIAQALDLLEKGFPHRPREFWQNGLSKLAQTRAHAEDGEPVGYLRPSGGNFIGVGLTPVSHRVDAAGRKRIVNLSSWFVLPEHRWKLPLLLRRMMHDDKATYTDLTPTRGVEKILEKLDFRPLNNGVAVTFTPVAAATSRHAPRILPWVGTRHHHLPCHEVQLIEDHLALGCHAFLIETHESFVPVVLKPGRMLGVPGSTVIFCPDQTIFFSAMSGLSRKLAAMGRMILVKDLPAEGDVRLPHGTVRLHSRRRRYVRGSHSRGAIDHGYSELVFFDL